MQTAGSEEPAVHSITQLRNCLSINCDFCLSNLPCTSLNFSQYVSIAAKFASCRTNYPAHNFTISFCTVPLKTVRTN